jgi:hypothetical protein
VVVAWGCDWRQDLDRAYDRVPGQRSWPAPVPFSWGQEHFVLVSESTGVSEWLAHGITTDMRRLLMVRCDAGWPLRSVRRTAYVWSRTEDAVPGRECGIFRPGIVIELDPMGRTPAHQSNTMRFLDPITRRHACLSLMPVWPGFAANTLLYAALAWVPLRGVGTLRRWRRSRRGRCPACGYDLAGLAAGTACPECGWEAGAEP